MTTKKITPARHKTSSTPIRQLSLSYCLDALLHTMRCITQYENVLCELSHEVKRAGALSTETGDELLEVLEQIPSYDYLLDMEAVRAALVEQRPPKSLTRKKSAKLAADRKRFNVSRKKSGRKSSR